MGYKDKNLVRVLAGSGFGRYLFVLLGRFPSALKKKAATRQPPAFPIASNLDRDHPVRTYRSEGMQVDPPKLLLDPRSTRAKLLKAQSNSPPPRRV